MSKLVWVATQCLVVSLVWVLSAPVDVAAAQVADTDKAPQAATQEAKGAAGAMAPGTVTPKVTSLDDPNQQLAFYVPSAYTAERSWPVLFVMDPRGRAEMALELFRPAAEEHGWIVLSSYQTRSDSNDDPNTPALKAMLGDAQKRFAIDSRRIYLTGMSGTSKVCWPFARMLEGNVAGVIGVAGAMPPNMTLDDRVPFAYFGITSDHDFNFREMRELRHALQQLGAVHNFGVFEGPHGWAPQALSGQAVAWLELIAMRDGLAPHRDEFIDAQLAAARARAEQAEAGGDWLAAYEAFDQAARDFDRLRDVSTLRAKADALAERGEVRSLRDRERKLLRDERQYRESIQRWLNQVAARSTPMPAKRSMVMLQIASLQEDAAGSDRQAAQSAQRRLETIFVQTAFYLPSAYRERQDLERAQAVLELATRIKPESAWPYWQLASLHAERGTSDGAFEALRAAAERGPVDLERLKRDPQWLPLHEDERWQSFVASLDG